MTRQLTRREMLVESAALGLAATTTKLSAATVGRANSRVCLLVEPGIPSESAPANLATLLSQAPGATVVTRDAAAISAQGIDADVFCNSHGSVYPAEVGDNIYEFLTRGGSLLHVGGIPFGRAMTRKDGAWASDDKAATTLREKLGIHTYGPAFPLDAAPSMRETYDSALMGLEPGTNNLPQASVNITTTLPLHVADPSLFGIYSITYLAKPVCRHTHIAGQLEDPAGKSILSSLLFTKTWRNPYDAERAGPCGPWAISTATFAEPMAPEMFAKMWAWVAAPAFLGAIELERATLRPGEETIVTAPIHGTLPTGWTPSAQVAAVTLEEWKSGKAPQWANAKVRAGSTEVGVQVHDEGRPDAFLFCVRLLLSDETGKVRDYSESAVVAWRPEALKSGPRLRRNGNYLDYSMDGNERPASFQVGTNWQDSEVYGLTWHNPNPLRIATDARSMAEQGLRVLRVHYVMPEFLRVLAADVFRRTSADFYHQFEAGPELTERHLRAFEAHAMVMGRLGIVLMPTVYTCVGPSMGNCQSWLFTSERYEIPDMIEAQKAFARQVMDRVGALPSISWDLVNEPDVALPTVGRWFESMRPILAATGQLTGIGTSGLDQNLSLGESADWHSVHANCTTMVDAQVFRTGKPHFFHEAWVHSESTAEGEIEDERILCQTIARTVVRGACGFMPWNWNKLLAYWRYGASETEIGDLTLGCCAQGEGVRRRGWFALRNWSILLDGAGFDQSLAGQVVYVYPKLTITGDRPSLWMDVLRGQNVPFLGVNDRDLMYFSQPNPRFSIVPQYGLGYLRSTYEKIMNFAAEGGIVWAHADSLRRDENGRLDPTRNVQFTNARIPYGKGAIEWYFGWSIPTKWEPGTSSHRFEQLVRSMTWKRPPEGTMPLIDGELRFQGDKEQKEIRTIQIADKDGTITRAWSGFGDSLAWPGISLSSPGQLFVIQLDAKTFHVYGEKVRVEANAPVTTKLIDSPGFALASRRAGSATVIEPQGWQRGCWFDLRLG